MFRSSLYIRGRDITAERIASEVRLIVDRFDPHFIVRHGVSSRTQIRFVVIHICDNDDTVIHISQLHDFMDFFFNNCRNSSLLASQPWDSCTLVMTATNGHKYQNFVRTMKFEEDFVNVCASNRVRIEVEVCPMGDESEDESEE